MARHAKRHKVKTTFLYGIAIREVRPGYYLADTMRDGKRIRRAFRSMDDADVWCKSKSVEIRNQGTAALVIGDRERVEYREAVKALDGRATLAEVVQYWLERHPTYGVEKWDVAALRYLQTMRSADRRAASVADKEVKLSVLGDALADAAPITLEPADVERVVKELADARGWGAVTSRAYVGAGLTLLRFVRNQSKRVYARDETPPAVWDAATVERLLHAAEAVAPEAVACLAVMAFAGVRPNEALRLRWEHISIDAASPVITLSGDVTKTRATRHVAISPNLREWLTKYRSDDGMLYDGSVSFRAQRERSMQAAGITNWPVDVLRHTYATMMYGRCHDASYTASQLGHGGGTGLFERHYRGLMPRHDDIEAFWKILPSDVSQEQ